ncbi:MAG: site-specific integrase [Bacteroidota bacterium]|nr:site-specific integrase [Bacteroidota bacterium]
MKKTLTTTFAVYFHLKIASEKDGKMPIYARITVNGKRIELSARNLIEPFHWDKKRGAAKPLNDSYKKLNNFLEQTRSSYFECYREMCLQKLEITTENFKKEYFGYNCDEYTLLKLINYHNIDMKELISWGTMKNYHTTQKYLEKFLREKMKREDIPLDKINYKFIVDFEYYLKTYIPTDHQKRIGNNGIMKHMERFKKMINMALKNEWMEKNPFKAYKLKFIKFERGYLTESELKNLEEKNFTIERLQNVMDLFIFSCYTGLSYIDAIHLTPSNIVTGIDGERWINTQRRKTNISVKVPVLPKASEIIDKYSNDPRCQSDESLLPRISNQKLNSYLKEIADLCNIKKNLTFHLARHTFATTITLSNGVPIESVSKMLGHSKISTTQIYAKVIERKLSEDMHKLKEKLSVKYNQMQKM